MEWNDIAPHLVGLAHIATSTPDGQPAVAVVSPLVEGDHIWVSTHRTSAKAKNLVVNPHIALMLSLIHI